MPGAPPRAGPPAAGLPAAELPLTELPLPAPPAAAVPAGADVQPAMASAVVRPSTGPRASRSRRGRARCLRYATKAQHTEGSEGAVPAVTDRVGTNILSRAKIIGYRVPAAVRSPGSPRVSDKRGRAHPRGPGRQRRGRRPRQRRGPRPRRARAGEQPPVQRRADRLIPASPQLLAVLLRPARLGDGHLDADGGPVLPGP